MKRFRVEGGNGEAGGAELPPPPPAGRKGEGEPLPVGQLGQEQLEERIAVLSAGCTAKVQRFAEEVASGATKAAAARAAGLSSKGGAPWRVLERPEVAELVALLRERAGRDARVTLESQIARVQKLGRYSEDAGDVGAALRAEDMVNRLAGLYPKDSSVIVPGAAVQIVVNTGLPAREPQTLLVGPSVPTELPPACVERVVVPEDQPREHEVPVPQAKAGDAQSLDRELTVEELFS